MFSELCLIKNLVEEIVEAYGENPSSESCAVSRKYVDNLMHNLRDSSFSSLREKWESFNEALGKKPGFGNRKITIKQKGEAILAEIEKIQGRISPQGVDERRSDTGQSPASPAALTETAKKHREGILKSTEREVLRHMQIVAHFFAPGGYQTRTDEALASEISSLFENLLTLPKERRAPFIQELCRVVKTIGRASEREESSKAALLKYLSAALAEDPSLLAPVNNLSSPTLDFLNGAIFGYMRRANPGSSFVDKKSNEQLAVFAFNIAIQATSQLEEKDQRSICRSLYTLLGGVEAGAKFIPPIGNKLAEIKQIARIP